MKRFYLIIIAVLLCQGFSSAQGHMFWLNASDYHPKSGESVWIEIGWGHDYPRDQFISEGRIESVYALDGKGNKIPLKEIFPSFYHFTPGEDGAYRIVSVVKSGFLSVTTEGHKHGNRKELSNVVSCFRYLMDAEAWILVGNGPGTVTEKEMTPLKIVAMKDPGAIKSGETLMLKVMFQGKPLAGAKVTGTYTGREAEEDDPWAFEKESDTDGTVQVKLESAGQWFFRVVHETPYPDKDVADTYSFRTSLTLDVR